MSISKIGGHEPVDNFTNRFSLLEAEDDDSEDEIGEFDDDEDNPEEEPLELDQPKELGELTDPEEEPLDLPKELDDNPNHNE